MLTAVGALRKRWDLRPYIRYLSPHAAGHTPGPHQVHTPFASLMALAFSQIIEDRRVSSHSKVYPSTGLSQLLSSSRHLRGCTIRFMLRPAVSASTPGWVRPADLRAVSVPCRGKLSPRVTTRTRPQPTYLKGQLIRQPPFRLLDNGLATSHIYLCPSPSSHLLLML
jgi:hypothetical protein